MVDMLGYFRSHNRESTQCCLLLQIFLLRQVMSSLNKPSHEATSGIYTLAFYRRNGEGNSYATSYDNALRKCNEIQSRLVVLNPPTKKMIDNYVSSSEYYWVHGKGSATCTAYHGSQGVNKDCNDMYLYICEQIHVNSVKLTNYDVTITGKTTITCTALGFPIPSITGKRNNTEIIVHSTIFSILYQIKSSGNSILHLKDLNVTDEGEYTCHATNKLGSKSDSTKVKVPSIPTIESVTANSCNSNLVIKWKPHSRAIGVGHKLSIRDWISNTETGTYYNTPLNDSSQTITAENLTSRNKYSIVIRPCSTVDKCYKYTTSANAVAGGIPSYVWNATLKKEVGICQVSWNPPPNSGNITGYQIHIKTNLAFAPSDVTVQQSNNVIVFNSSVLSYSIPSLPNRNYTVHIRAKTCAGLGNTTTTSGDCVTDAAAPSSVDLPQLQDENFNNEKGTSKIYFSNPDERNGFISCVVIAVNLQYDEEKDNLEILLREINAENSTSRKGYVAIAANRSILKNHKTRENGVEILRFTLGDESKTECDMKNENLYGQRKNDSNSTAVIKGHNERLENDKQYQIRVITSTPSGFKVLFQVSKELNLNYSTAQVADNSQIILISVGVVVFIAVLLLVLYAFFVRRRTTWKFTEPAASNDISHSAAGLERRANRFETFQETEDFSDQFDNETTDIGVVVMSEIKPQIVIPIPCEESEKTQPEDPYENYMSDTAVDVDELEQYFRKHAEDNNALFFEQYQDIKSKSRENMKSREVASNPDFKRKNRYKNILPFDSTRVVLKGNETGYINACYIDGFKQHNKYIATQGPLSSTVVDFWLMVIEQNCNVIVMLAKCTEGGKKKCYKYWPDLDASLTFGSSIVENVNEVKCCGFVRRSFRIYVNNGEREMEVIQYQYLAWPDHGVPFTTSNLVRMQKVVKATIQEADDNSPLLVHCRSKSYLKEYLKIKLFFSNKVLESTGYWYTAGAGRSGTYIGYDILLEEAESQNTIDFYSCVMKMRSQRIDMIQTCDQYILLHKLMLERYTFSETDFPTDGIKSYFQELIRDKYVLSSNFEMLASLVHVETTETNVRNRATIHGNKNYSAQRNVLFIPPEHGEFNPPQIDAFWIEAYDENGFMIAARDPTESTVNSFWRGVLYNKVNTIIMLSDDQECFQYWPSSIEGNIKIGSVTVTLLEQAIDGAIIERSLKVCDEYREITVTHFQCTDWDANGCPTNGRSVLKVVEEMRLKIRQNVGYTSLIHCSDGVGRTGTFCTVVNLIDRLKNEGRVDVFSAVKDLRDCKRGMVQTLDQYVFCHQVIIDYLKTFELYSNFE